MEPDNGVINEELWTDERIGHELNPDSPLRLDSVRREMSRAGIAKVSGRPARLVKLLLERRAAKHRTDDDR